MFKAQLATASQKLPYFGLWVSLGGLCLAIVPCCVAEQPYIGRQNGSLEVFNPQFIVSSIISRTSLLGRDTPPLKLELRSENNPGFDCLAISGTEIYGQLSDSIWETLETDLGMAR